MKTERFPGIYGDILPDGNKVYSLIGEAKIVLNGQIIAAPSEMMFNRLTNVGGLKVASKTHDPGTVSVFENGAWRDTQLDSPGVQGHAWNPDGTLVVIEGAEDQESQGLRFYDPSLPESIASLDITHKTPGWVTGSPSYSSGSPLAHALGVTRLAGWTKLGDIVVGQGTEDIGGAVIQYHGQHYLLEPGDTQFIQFHRDGSTLAVAITKLLDREVVFRTFDASEITSLPLYAAPAPVEPKPEPQPEPTPEPTPMYEIPEELHDQRQLVEAVRPEPYSDTYDVNAEWAKQIAMALKRLYPHLEIGVARAKGGSPNRGGAEDEVPEGFTTDVIALKSGVHWDFKSDGGVASWGLEDDEANYPTIANRFWPAEKLEGFDRLPTDPQEPPVVVDTPSDEPDYAGILDMILDKIGESVKVEVDRAVSAVHEEVEGLRKELDGLTFEGRHRLLGTMTFTRKR